MGKSAALYFRVSTADQRALTKRDKINSCVTSRHLKLSIIYPRRLPGVGPLN
jgi:hypothetical protein